MAVDREAAGAALLGTLATEGDDAALAEAVAAILGVDVPGPAIAGVAANVRLLARHWANVARALADQP